MIYILAASPILLVLFLMIFFRWGGQHAGPVGWAAAVIIAWLSFGLTFDVWWISQLKGLLLSLFVLVVLWPALLLYHTVNEVGGIRAIAHALESSMSDRGFLLVLLAWAFSGFLEGIAGAGIPVAVVAPMLMVTGVPPVSAVAAVAVGHAWAVSLGNMGVIFETLTSVTGLASHLLAQPSAIILGIACLACGLSSAMILGQLRSWPKIIAVATLMATIQYIAAVVGAVPLAALLAGLCGLAIGMLANRRNGANLLGQLRQGPLLDALAGYGGLVTLMLLASIPGRVHIWLEKFAWRPYFPAVITRNGHITPAGPGTALRFFLNPGFILFVTACLSYVFYRLRDRCPAGSWRPVLRLTYTAAMPASLGVMAAIGISTLMDHCGMTLLLAQGLSVAMQTAYPLVSPLVGMLGAFATGSNNNSNVLFASMQKNIALLLELDACWLLAAQTAGGSLGSMVAPAKIIVGCSTAGLQGKDGNVLRVTAPYGLAIGLLIGVVVFVITYF